MLALFDYRIPYCILYLYVFSNNSDFRMKPRRELSINFHDHHVSLCRLLWSKRRNKIKVCSPTFSLSLLLSQPID